MEEDHWAEHAGHRPVSVRQRSLPAASQSHERGTQRQVPLPRVTDHVDTCCLNVIA